MEKIITKYDYDLSKFYYDDVIKIGDNKSKIKIYRLGEGFKYNRIFIKLPRMRLAFDPNKDKYNNISVSLHPLTEEIKEFCNFNVFLTLFVCVLRRFAHRLFVCCLFS